MVVLTRPTWTERNRTITSDFIRPPSRSPCREKLQALSMCDVKRETAVQLQLIAAAL